MMERETGLLLLCFIALCTPHSTSAATNPDDVSALTVLYASMNSAAQLRGWMANGGDPCGQAWLGISCSGSRIVSIKLSGMGLTGNLGYNMNLLTALADLDLSNNNLGINATIPYNLPPHLQMLNLAGNQFGESPPYSISLMTNLLYLNLGHNQFITISDFFSNLSNLTFLDLSYNKISGDLGRSFSSLTSLTTLHLQNNNYSGTIDVLADLPLEDLNVSDNMFTGWIPDKLKTVKNLQASGNQWSSSPAPPPPPYQPPPPSPPQKRTTPYLSPPSTVSGRSPSNADGNRSPSSGTTNTSGAAGTITGAIIAVLILGGIVGFIFYRRKSVILHTEKLMPKQNFTHLASFKDSSMDMSSVSEEEPFPPLKPPPRSHRSFDDHEFSALKPPPKSHKSFDDHDFSNRSFAKKIAARPSIKAKLYTVADLQTWTNSFSVDNLLGEGSFGRVFKAKCNNDKLLAVKKVSLNSFPNRSSEDFLDLVSGISQLRHSNLVELVGYCAEYGQQMLVYEFFRNGSLYDLLHNSDEQSRFLSWNNRNKIALGSARALEYLHEVCLPCVIHKNFTSSNLLLDMELNPHLSDCGLGNLVPCPEFQASDQKAGYSPPEVSESGQYSLKSDVYNFGVVMLELMTGRMPFDRSRGRQEQLLVRWAAPQLHDIEALDHMVDPALDGLYPPKSLSRFADIIALCVQPEPEFRPPMSEVVQQLVRLVQRTNDTNGRSHLADVPDYLF